MKHRLATLEIGAYTIGPAVKRSREGYERKFGKNPQDPGGWYRDGDWHRTSIVLDSLAPGSVLDVGAGAGQFINGCTRAASGRSTQLLSASSTSSTFMPDGSTTRSCRQP